MNIGINLDHQTNTSLQLNLAPQLLQWLRLLQIPTTELASLVQKELEKNPALEVDGNGETPAETPFEESSLPPEPESDIPDAPPVAETVTDNEDADRDKRDMLAELDEEWNSDSASIRRQTPSDSESEDKQRYILDSITANPSLQEHLLRQLPITEMDDNELMTAEMIIGSIDEKGYLPLPLSEIAAAAGSTENETLSILSTIQSFDPAGIAARDLRECLLLQMQTLDPASLPVRIVTEHLDALARKQFTDIATALDTTVEAVMDAQRTIKSLNPEPGSRFSSKNTEYINADVIIHNMDDVLFTELNDTHIPRLRISAGCRQLLEKTGLKPDEANYLRNKIRSASFLIQGIRQRQATLQRVADQIVSLQKEFLVNPKGELKPLTMAKIAAIINVHETTVSRAIANKHIMTPRGLFEMKHFFRAGYRCADGSAITPDTVKNMIEELVENENPVSPLKDITMARILEKRSGLRLARRTIAKYREEIGIPSSKERRRLSLATAAQKSDKPGRHKHMEPADQLTGLRTAGTPSFAEQTIETAVA